MSAISAQLGFLLGFIGALAPEIVRLYSIRSKPKSFKWSWFYVVVSLLLAGLGGLTALLLPATTYWAAFYAGISAPVLITTAAKKAPSLKPQLKSAATSVPEPPHFSVFLNAL